MKFLLVIVLFFFVGYVKSKSLETKNNTDDSTTICESARRTYRSAGYQEEDIYTLKRTEKSLKVCGKDMTCCKAQAELNLVNLSERKRTGLTNPLQVELNQTFHQTRGRFQELTRELLKRSHENLNQMFKTTYGHHYETNKHVFKSLYTSFNQYLSGSELELSSSMNSFFAKLFEKVYTMTKPWSKFTKEYQNCIYESTNVVKPFGLMQTKIGRLTSRAFLASRIFMQGLKEGMEVIMKLLQLPVHDDCSIAFMKMTQCSICSSISDSMKPCSNYCGNVMKGCFAYIIMIQPKWNEFIKEMVVLVEKLEGPFSLEAVVEPLGVKISEAIMVFQENLANITTKVESICGKLPTDNTDNTDNNNNRDRRSLDYDSKKLLTGLKLESEKILNGFISETKKTINGMEEEETEDAKIENNFMFSVDGSNKKQTSEFEMLLHATKLALIGLKDYWVNLSEILCKAGIAADQNENCWNGVNTTGYHLDVIQNSVHDLFNKNPEMKLNPSLPNVMIINQAKKLEEIIRRIRSTLNGNEVNCVDCSEGSTDGGSTEESSDGSTDPTDETSGSGETTTVPTTVNKCDNSVDEECIETIQSTKNPNEILDNGEIPFKQFKNTNTDPNSGSIVITTNVVLMLVGLLSTLL